MTRFFLATLASSLIATIALAADPPTAMPANPAAKPTAATVMPPAAAPEMAAMPIAHDGPTYDATGCCDGRPGFLDRIRGRSCGHRHACIEPAPCSNSFPSYGSYTPVYTSFTSGCVQSDERCRRLGIKRFVPFTEREKRCTPAFGRLKAWFGLARCTNEAEWKAMPTPYHTPLRYYFEPDGEPACVAKSCEGVTQICPGGAIRENPVAARTIGGGIGIGSGRLRAALSGEGCRDGQCRRKEECYGIPGSNFQGSVRYARDEKAAVSPINSGKPDEYEGSWHNDGYGSKPKDTPPLVQASRWVPVK